MRKLFIFDFDDTLANYSAYNTWTYKSPVPIFPRLGGTIKDAKKVLDFVNSRGDEIKMVTMNIVLSEEQKWRKLERVGMRRWFHEENVWMVKRKTPELFMEVCGGKDPRSCYMVGNSYTNDIKPSLKAGINALYIPRPRIKRILRVPDIDNPRMRVLGSIGEIIDIYESL